MPSVCRCSVNEWLSLAKAFLSFICFFFFFFWPELHVHVCAHACVHTHSTTFDWISQRESFQPQLLLHWSRAALSILNSSISSPRPNLLDALLSHSLAWSLLLPLVFELPPFSSHLSLSFFAQRRALTPSLSCRCVFHPFVYFPLMFLSYLNLRPFLLIPPPSLSFPPSPPPPPPILHLCRPVSLLLRALSRSISGLSFFLSVAPRLILNLDSKWFLLVRGINCH